MTLLALEQRQRIKAVSANARSENLTDISAEKMLSSDAILLGRGRGTQGGIPVVIN